MIENNESQVGGKEDVPAKATAASPTASITPQKGKVFQLFDWIGVILPGVAIAFLIAYFSKTLSDYVGKDLMGFKKSPLSPIMVAIVLGIIIRNIIGLPTVYAKGLTFCVKKILRIGIAVLGLRLSLMAVGETSLTALPLVIICIASALLLVTWIGRAFGLPKRLASLIAVGTSICGVSAIVATAPAIDAEDDEVSYAVACITIFGMLALFIHPFLAHYVLFSGDAQQAGYFMGTAINDTSQVTGAAIVYQQQFDAPVALDIAVVTKLVRNLFMAVVIPLMAILYHRNSSTTGGSRKKWYQMIPLFVIGFVALAAVRTIGDIGDKPFGFLKGEVWSSFTKEAINISKWCLAIALAAVGLNTSFAKLKNLGWKPFCVGFIAATLVGAVSFTFIKFVLPIMPF